MSKNRGNRGNKGQPKQQYKKNFCHKVEEFGQKVKTATQRRVKAVKTGVNQKATFVSDKAKIVSDFTGDKFNTIASKKPFSLIKLPNGIKSIFCKHDFDANVITEEVTCKKCDKTYSFSLLQSMISNDTIS